MHGNKQNVTGYVDYVEGKVTQEDLYEGQSSCMVINKLPIKLKTVPCFDCFRSRNIMNACKSKIITIPQGFFSYMSI